ncbi:hypothetical protein [Pedobacter rhizosphaerae]|uniref:Uncharacterized protein n=1 Tax=Pedobacter rhizosphaerae TaxID=390241 RepID=A0A1H9R303_9SPHI|nr:hypothetical protein [Pedobacter rhizosphaerae]SER67092.1 hypothetical protein SAMN04488023_113106 [Pedobacter rhizosphaerae]
MILVWTIISCKSVQQQAKVPELSGRQQNVDIKGYKKLETFKGDTPGYLHENFVKQKQKYINQPLEEILKELEIPIVKYAFTPNGQDMSTSPAIILKIYDERRLIQIEKNKGNPNILLITWAKPLPIEEAKAILTKSFANWDINAKDYYSMKIVGNVQLTGYPE